MSLLRISRDRDRMLEVTGRAWQEDGTLSARYWSEATKEMKDPAGIFYFWKGERPRDPNAPAIYGTGEIKLETDDRASGYWTTRSEADPPSTPGHQASTCAPRPTTSPSWTDATTRPARP